MMQQQAAALMDQPPPIYPQVSITAPGEPGLSSNAFKGATPFPVEVSTSGALLLGPYQTKDAYMKQFRELIQTKETLEKAGYVMQALSEHELAQKRKCLRCHRLIFKENVRHNGNGEPKGGNSHDKAEARQLNKKCKYHDGKFNGRVWTCCWRGPYHQPCKTSTSHLAAVYQPGELEQLYRYHRTPAAPPSESRCLAVAIDCEMGSGIANNSVLIRVALIDYFTSKVLIDKLVFPDEPLLHYNTRFSGVTSAQMAEARSRGKCLYGTAAARKAIWEFVGPDTIVVAHSGNNDLSVLRWIHGTIVDTLLLESLPIIQLRKEAREKEEKLADSSEGQEQSSKSHQPAGGPKKNKGKVPGPFSLKVLAKERLGRDIQMGQDGHDSVEDAMAARDIAHWNVLNFGHVVYQI